MFAIGITALLIHSSVMGVEFRFEFETAKDTVFRGLALLGAAILAVGIVFHFLVQNCPACKRNFREHPDFDEGLPVFNALDVCPFCLTPIDANNDSKAT